MTSFCSTSTGRTQAASCARDYGPQAQCRGPNGPKRPLRLARTSDAMKGVSFPASPCIPECAPDLLLSLTRHVATGQKRQKNTKRQPCGLDMTTLYRENTGLKQSLGAQGSGQTSKDKGLWRKAGSAYPFAHSFGGYGRMGPFVGPCLFPRKAPRAFAKARCTPARQDSFFQPSTKRQGASPHAGLIPIRGQRSPCARPPKEKHR